MLRPRWQRIAALLIATTSACTSSPPDDHRQAAATPAASSAVTAAASPVVARGVDPIAPPQPPDGQWLTDEHGDQYFGQRIEMPPGAYVWLDEAKTRARLRHGIEVEVLDHDDKSLTIKIYRTDDDPPPPPRAVVPSADELGAVAATYLPQASAGPSVRLEPIDDGLPTRGQWRNGFDVADLNGDGKLDIAFGPPRKARRGPALFLNDGDGRWSAWSDARFPDLPFDYGDAAVGDLNGDGKQDLVLASHLRGIVAMLGDGKGTFTAWTDGIEFALPGNTATPATFTSRAITLADWNDDGRLDVIGLGEGPRLQIAPGKTSVGTGPRGIAVYLNEGDGTWTKRQQSASGNFGSSLAVADLTGDGRLDILTGTDRRGFRGLLNVGQPDNGWRETDLPELRPDALVRSVAVADFDGDGRNDIVLGYLSSELGIDRRGIDVLLARDGGSWQRKTLLADETAIAVGALATGDVNADGAADVAAADDEGALHLFLGDGRGGFARGALEAPQPGGTCKAYSVRLAPLDATPGDDIVVAFADEDDGDALTGSAPCPSQGSLKAFRVNAD